MKPRPASLPKDAALAIAQMDEILDKTDDAERDYKAALEAAPQDVAVIRTVADFYGRAGKPQLAEAMLRRILDGKVPTKEPDMMWARRQLASIDFATPAAITKSSRKRRN